MFTKKTVLVLGAGASRHYGYPTGEELIDRMLYTIKERNFIFPSRRSQKLPLYDNEPYYTALYKQLEFYDPLSIDSFLSQFSEKAIVDAGKALIAYEILEAENEELLKRTCRDPANGPYGRKKTENWYRFLHNALTANCTPQKLIEDNLNLQIITFNYDNSLEHSLYSRFYNSPLLASKAAAFLQKISANIIHIYGQVGKFQWKGGTDRGNDDYGQYKDDTALNRAEQLWKDSIFVIGQDRDNQVQKNADMAQQWLREAETIFFLGFGFNDDNIQLLKLQESTANARQIFCTNFRDSRIIKKKIEQLFNRTNSTTQKINGKDAIALTPREAIISHKTVYDALAEDFSLIS